MRTMFFGYNFGKLSLAITRGKRPEKGDWKEINPVSLGGEIKTAYNEYKAAYKLAKEAREAFERKVRTAAGIDTSKPVHVGKSAGTLEGFITASLEDGRAI